MPTLDDVARLTPQSDYSRFVGSGVDPSVSNAAMKKLFADPHYNVMDGLDTYIDDYSVADPIPLALLRKMNQAMALGLFDEASEAAKAEPPVIANPGPACATPHAQACPHGDAAVAVAELQAQVPQPVGSEPEIDDDDADLRLQQDDATGRTGAGPRDRG